MYITFTPYLLSFDNVLFRYKSSINKWSLQIQLSCNQYIHVSIFTEHFSDLDYGKLATGFGLLRIPKMPELRGKTVGSFTPADVDFDAIPFKWENPVS